jgi:predicted lipid-binding transport protein (Tim44 family)
LANVERAFFTVEEAWTELKPDMSRQVMADGVWQQHKSQIEGYQHNGTRNVLDGLALGHAAVIAASSDATYDTITVRLLAACADYDIEVANGKVIRGNKHDMTNWQEDWTFTRSSDATTKADGGTMQKKCPNCGAPLDVDLAGVCKYCKQGIMSGKYDWVLSRIDQVV